MEGVQDGLKYRGLRRWHYIRMHTCTVIAIHIYSYIFLSFNMKQYQNHNQITSNAPPPLASRSWYPKPLLLHTVTAFSILIISKHHNTLSTSALTPHPSLPSYIWFDQCYSYKSCKNVMQLCNEIVPPPKIHSRLLSSLVSTDRVHV